MKIGYLDYPLVDGYIHNWLVAGPQIIDLLNLSQSIDPEYRMRVAEQYDRRDLGIHGKPIEFGVHQYTEESLADKEHPVAKVQPPDMGYLAGNWRYVNTNHDHLVDLSAFYPTPHYLRAWAYTEIASSVHQEVTIILTTNGPADLWINGQHIHRQVHFNHQSPKRVRFQVTLKSGINRLMVRFEEVAMRECPYGMALQLIGFQVGEETKEKIVRIPTMAPSPVRRLQLECLFEGSHIRQDVFARKEEIMVYLPEGTASGSEFVIRMQNPKGAIYAEANRRYGLELQNQTMGFPYQAPGGEYQLIFMPSLPEYYEHNVRITRIRQFYAATNTFSTQPYGTYEERCIEALKDAARGEDTIFSEIAKMELGYWKSVNAQVVFNTIESINRRGDCSDFNLCGLLGMLYRYSDKDKFPAELHHPLEDCILNFKYWDDEPGQDAMCYRTENHSILFHTCEVLAGQRYPERNFTNADHPGKWHLEKGEHLALEWLQNRARSGFKEWDSNTYFEEDTLALSTLASLAENPQVWELAALVLDKLLFTMAVNSYKGVFGSTHGRSYSTDIKTGYREATSGISRLLWGMGIFNDHIRGTVSLACSSYALPPIIANIAADQPEEFWSKEQHAGTEQDFRNSGSIGSEVNKVTYKTPDAMLCSAQDWHPGEPGYQQHIWQATLSPEVTIFTSHPSCASEDSSHRPNYWHGNVVLPRVAQWKDFLIAIYNFAEDDWMGFTHAYFPVHGMAAYEIRDQWAFGKVGDGYVALAAANGVKFQTRGDNAYRELRSPGTPNVWLCQLGRAALDGSFDEFKEKILSLPVTFDGTQVKLTSLRGDRLRFGWQKSLLVNGKRQPLSGYKHYDNPYCTCELGAPIMEINHGGETLRLHFEEEPETEK